MGFWGPAESLNVVLLDVASCIGSTRFVTWLETSEDRVHWVPARHCFLDNDWNVELDFD